MIMHPTFDLEQVFEELVESGVMNGVVTEEGYHDLVDETIEDHRRIGEFQDDQNTEGYVTTLKERWPEYQKRLASQG